METILCVPGNWKDRSELVQAIAAATSGDYLFAGAVLMHAPTKDAFKIEFRERDERMAQAFAASSHGWIGEADLAAIDAHQSVVYIIAESGTTDTADAAMEAAQALVLAGGLGVKVETSGKAFTGPQWDELAASAAKQRFFEAFVVMHGLEDGSFFTCGMHNLGLRDAHCAPGLSGEDAVRLMSIFLNFEIIEAPQIENGQTFSISPDAPKFQILEQPCTIHAEGDLFYNPYGMHLLVPAG